MEDGMIAGIIIVVVLIVLNIFRSNSDGNCTYNPKN